MNNRRSNDMQFRTTFVRARYFPSLINVDYFCARQEIDVQRCLHCHEINVKIQDSRPRHQQAICMCVWVGVGRCLCVGECAHINKQRILSPPFNAQITY
jgi:hypothetical protein